ncbi:type II toxin-antitoxin system PemK/MazF family toxin [Clostridium tagluense]|uniref:Tetratricopeptide repeat protein n=1 Tax=Clostridium tagluense TaxID=360422 RepID=A0A401UTD7_9CLOT|nr:type II toxin-antitoxin system PemK/MazF family toxin [Clostridium tagluense]GCD12718.1 hypothetical protein Ctaglu_43410 [Clostridium tagluense]
MSRPNYFRWEIWMADCSKYNLENHFVVIISNFKMNNKHKSVHCCIITSKLNSYKSRVDIELLKPSQIACETILTLPKTDLLYKLTDVKDIFTKLEVEKNLEIQFQLSNNFINTDIEQMENFLEKGVLKMGNESKLGNLRNNICNLAVENKYEQVIILCNESIKLASNSSLENRNDFLWHSTYHRSLMFSKLGNKEVALDDARESLKYVPSLRNTLSPKYSYSLWRLANCYENIGDIDGAIQIFKNLCKYYKKVGKTASRIEMIFNIYRLKNNLPKMKYLISLIEKMEFNERDTNKIKETLLKDMRQDVINMQ